jgi:hypothetical protein
MSDTPHPQLASLLARYRAELRDTTPSDSLDARIAALVAGGREESRPTPPAPPRVRFWPVAAAVAVVAIASGVYIGMRLERAAPRAQQAQQADALPADFSLWPADSVALQIPAEYSPQGTLVAVDPTSRSTGKRYWVDVVVSNDGTVRIERVIPAEPAHPHDTGVPDGITLQAP